MVRQIALAVLTGMTVTTVPLRAECIGTTIPNQKRTAARVFEALVTTIEPLEHGEFEATLHVHQVWKGDAPTETIVYFTSSFDGPSLERGKRYIFFVVPLSPVARKAYGLPPDHPPRSNWVPPCSGLALPVDSTVKQLGRSRKPNDRHVP